MANPSLPSFVELMASLGLQDEHTANALIRGATADTATPVTPIYRQSTDSLSTPLSSASLVTPLSSPSVQRDRPTSHGKKRYSPYGLSAIASGEIYTRRGSVPDLLSQAHYGQDRRLHHLSAPEPFHDHSSNSGRATDEDGDEEMEDAVPATRNHHNRPHTYKPSSSLHCAGQPNLLISRQRMRPAAAASAMPRTKSHSHMRTTSVTTQQQQQQQRHPIDMPMDTERTNDGDIAVVSISLLRRSHPQSRPPVVATSPTPVDAAATATVAAAPGPPAPGTTQSLDSPRGFQFPPSGPTSTLSPAPPHRTPPSAPPTKTSFGFLPAGPAGNISATSISATRRARHARSSSARSVRDMIRERETNVLLAPLHSFHPMGETEEEREGSLKPTTTTTTEARIRPQSTGQLSAHSTTTEDGGGSTNSVPASSSTSAQSSFLPLDDSSRSFSHRRRVKRHTAEAATPRAGGKRSSPPPPLMLPTLSFNIRALVGGGTEADKDRLAVAGASDTGYVSRREPHSPDPRGSWRRRAAPLEVAGV